LGVRSAELPSLILVDRTDDQRVVTTAIPNNVKHYFAHMAEIDQAARAAEQEAEQALEKARGVLQKQQGPTGVRSIRFCFCPRHSLPTRRAGPRSRRWLGTHIVERQTHHQAPHTHVHTCKVMRFGPHGQSMAPTHHIGHSPNMWCLSGCLGPRIYTNISILCGACL